MDLCVCEDDGCRVLVPEDYPEDSLKFMKRFDIKLFKFPLEGNKVRTKIWIETQEPFTEIPEEMVIQMMHIILGTFYSFFRS